jgi:hypothetical protein
LQINEGRRRIGDNDVVIDQGRHLPQRAAGQVGGGFVLAFDHVHCFGLVLNAQHVQKQPHPVRMAGPRIVIQNCAHRARTFFVAKYLPQIPP